MALDPNSPEYQAFIEAVKKGQLAEVKKLLDAYPELLDLPNFFGKTPLHVAASNGRDSIVELLLSRGPSSLRFGRQHGSISLNSLDSLKWTPLDWAVRNEHSQGRWRDYVTHGLFVPRKHRETPSAHF